MQFLPPKKIQYSNTRNKYCKGKHQKYTIKTRVAILETTRINVLESNISNLRHQLSNQTNQSQEDCENPSVLK